MARTLGCVADHAHPSRLWCPDSRIPRRCPFSRDGHRGLGLGPMFDEAMISVVLPVHVGVDPEAFRKSLDSVLGQTRPAEEIVVVEDGPLAESHNALLKDAALRHPGPSTDPTGRRTKALALRTRQAFGPREESGSPRRTPTTSRCLAVSRPSSPSLRDPAQISAEAPCSSSTEIRRTRWHIREAPLDHESIARKMRTNNPINHPTAMYRRSAALDCGGYPDLRLMQDYVLFARMLASGARMTNLSEPLVLFRAGDGLHQRRSGRGFSPLGAPSSA